MDDEAGEQMKDRILDAFNGLDSVEEITTFAVGVPAESEALFSMLWKARLRPWSFRTGGKGLSFGADSIWLV